MESAIDFSKNVIFLRMWHSVPQAAFWILLHVFQLQEPKALPHPERVNQVIEDSLLTDAFIRQGASLLLSLTTFLKCWIVYHQLQPPVSPPKLIPVATWAYSSVLGTSMPKQIPYPMWPPPSCQKKSVRFYLLSSFPDKLNSRGCRLPFTSLKILSYWF